MNRWPALLAVALVLAAGTAHPAHSEDAPAVTRAELLPRGADAVKVTDAAALPRDPVGAADLAPATPQPLAAVAAEGPMIHGRALPADTAHAAPGVPALASSTPVDGSGPAAELRRARVSRVVSTAPGSATEAGPPPGDTAATPATTAPTAQAEPVTADAPAAMAAPPPARSANAADRAATAAGAGVDLLQLAAELDATFEWHPFRQLGVLTTRGRRVALRVGTPWVLIDDVTPLYVGTVAREGGAIMLPAAGAAELRRVLSVVSPEPTRRIAALLIDPGHGGRDPGTSGSHQVDGTSVTVIEKDVVLATSRQLHGLLQERYPGKQVILTRDDDTYLTLEDRVQLANDLTATTEDAIVFLSIHANASLNDDARGFEVWYLPPDYRRTLITADSVDSESRELVPILNTMLEEEYTRESVILAQTIVERMETMVGGKSINRGIREESWFVVRNARMPAVLIELGFATNPQEAQLLASPGYLQTLAEAIYSAVQSFVTMFEQTDGFTRRAGG